MNKDEKSSKNSNSFGNLITLPWLIVTITSMVAFLAFIIAMFFNFYTGVFFGIFLLVIAAAVFLDGFHKRKENYISGNLNFIMGILCIVCSVIIMSDSF